VGQPGAFVRTTNRYDFAFEAPQETLVDKVSAAGLPATSIGKVKSIFGGRGFTQAVKAGHNPEITQALIDQLKQQDGGLIFANLVDFDMMFGHRRDPVGYAQALVEFDRRLPEILAQLHAGDLLIMTADHGCDPTYAGTNHTREYVPVLAWRKGGRGQDLGILDTMADVGATLSDWLGTGPLPAGTSFLERV
jgi:phosphopentomutase